jgi:hypothetical protein
MIRPALRAEQRPQDCWDWITREEVTRMALVAFEMARKNARPPIGERFLDPSDGVAWSGREDFAQNVSSLFELQVKAEAHRLGIAGDQYADEVRRLAIWRADAVGGSVDQVEQVAA